MFRMNDILYPTLGPVWRAFDLLDQINDERMPDRVDHQVRANEDEVSVVAMLPGLDRESLVIEVDDDVLHIRGERKDLTPAGAKVLRRERDRASYERLIRLPYEVEDNQAEATYEDGVLTVHLPRAAASKPRRIAVKSSKAIEHS